MIEIPTGGELYYQGQDLRTTRRRRSCGGKIRLCSRTRMVR